MALHTFVDFEQPEAFELARLTSIRQDLSSTIDLCRYFQAQIEASPNHYLPFEITDAFSTAVVIRYSRAFVNGVRHGLRGEEIAFLTEEQYAAHEHFRALRDKHFAHSVNAFEETRIQARYCLERVDKEGITGIGAAHYRVLGLSGGDLTTIVDLCECILERISEMENEEKRRLLLFIRNLPLADVLSAKSSPLLTPSAVFIEKRRKRP